jgi:hypothetical protein
MEPTALKWPASKKFSVLKENCVGDIALYINKLAIKPAWKGRQA